MQNENFINTRDLLGASEYSQEAVNAFMDLTEIEFIWFDMLYHPTILSAFINELHHISLERTAELTKIMSRIIDYQSAFTAMHSAGVSASAQKLAELAGMSREDCIMMKIAGDLHDVGKLKIPKAILEKPGRLTDEERNIIKEHPYNTRLVLMPIQGFGKIADWAGYHHEKLNGNGYPFHFGADVLDTGSRILAVADIFSAITERRPYRDSMPKEKAMSVPKKIQTRVTALHRFSGFEELYSALSKEKLGYSHSNTADAHDMEEYYSLDKQKEYGVVGIELRMTDLQKYIDAQEKGYDFGEPYQTALSEIKNGRKITHWIGYVFPQIQGLGWSGITAYFSIRDIIEATDYYEHPVLGARLIEITEALYELNCYDLVPVLGLTDALKLRSCMTLFNRAIPQQQLFKKCWISIVSAWRMIRR